MTSNLNARTAADRAADAIVTFDHDSLTAAITAALAIVETGATVKATADALKARGPVKGTTTTVRALFLLGTVADLPREGGETVVTSRTTTTTPVLTYAWGPVERDLAAVYNDAAARAEWDEWAEDADTLDDMLDVLPTLARAARKATTTRKAKGKGKPAPTAPAAPADPSTPAPRDARALIGDALAALARVNVADMTEADASALAALVATAEDLGVAWAEAAAVKA